MRTTGQRPAQPSLNESRAAAPGTRRQSARPRNQLKSDTDNMMSTKPAGRRDQYGSRHNEDSVKAHQRQIGRPVRAQNPAFRESGQDLQPDRGAKNKQPGRRRRKSGNAERRS